MFLHSLSSFLCKHCICGHKCDYSIVDMPSLRSARYICLAANSICFRYAQARYDIDPRSRSEHIECVSTYRTRQRISKIRASGSISTRSVLKGTTLTGAIFAIMSIKVYNFLLIKGFVLVLVVILVDYFEASIGEALDYCASALGADLIDVGVCQIIN